MKELLYAVVPVTLAALTIFLIERLYRKIDFRRTSKIRGIAERNGFRFIESKENLPLSYRPPSLGGISRYENIMKGKVDGRKFVFADVKVVVMVQGSESPVKTGAVVSMFEIDTGHDTLPWVKISPDNTRKRILNRFNHRDVDTEDYLYNKNFRTETNDRFFLIAVLTPDIIEQLRNVGSMVWETTSDGRIAAYWTKPAKTHQVENLLKTLPVLLSAVDKAVAATEN